MAVVLQPAASKKAKAHFRETITKGVELSNIRGFVTEEEYQLLNRKYPDGIARIWGVKNSKINTTKFDKVEYDDIVLFSADNMLFMSGRVSLKKKSIELAKILWGSDDDGKLWGNVYFVSNLKEQNITRRDFNTIMNYKTDFRIMGFSVLDEQDSNTIINTFNLD